jgi:hypothetical protein
MQLRPRTLWYNPLLAAILLTTFGPGFLLSQTVPQGPAFGITPFGSYVGYHIDSVNMENGNDIIKIPLFSLPQLGKLALSFSAVSNITYWEQAGGCSPDGLFCNYYYTNNPPAYNPISLNGGIGPAVVPDQIPSSV